MTEKVDFTEIKEIVARQWFLGFVSSERRVK